MRWKIKQSNLIVAAIFSILFTIVTLLNIIGPLHINATGTMNSLGILSLLSLAYWMVALGIIWGLYFQLRRKPELLFFILMMLGIIIILIEIFIWGWMGSQSAA